MPRWTEEEEGLLRTIRTVLKDKLMNRPQYPEVVGDRKLIRFIRGHGHDEEKVLEMVEKFLDWRDSSNVDQIRAKIVADNLDHWLKFPKGELITKLIDTVVIAPGALDFKGSPICVDQYGFSPSNVLSQITLDEYVHYVIYTLEYRSMILEQMSEERERELSMASGGAEVPGVVIQTCVIRDLGGVGFEHMGKQGQEIIKAVVSLASDNYPEMMRKCYMVNVPWVFNTLWYFMKNMLADRTVEKVSVFGNPFMPELTEDMKLESVPTLIPGGKYDTSGGYNFHVNDGGALGTIPQAILNQMYSTADVKAPMSKNGTQLPIAVEQNPMHNSNDAVTSPITRKKIKIKSKVETNSRRSCLWCCFKSHHSGQANDGSYDDTKDISEVSMHSPPPSPVKAAGELEQEERSSECDSQVYVVQGTVSFS